MSWISKAKKKVKKWLDKKKDAITNFVTGGAVKEQEKANKLAEEQYNNTLQQQQEAQQEALNERKEQINNTRRQLINNESDLTIGNKKKSRFTLLDNNKTLG